MQRRFASVATLLTVVLGGWAAPARAETEPFGRLDVAQVEALLGRKDVVIFDVNSAEVYARGHLPGARWSGMDEVGQKLPADKTLTLVYYCHNER
jgi:rhodanese-related sulfurtransferase